MADATPQSGDLPRERAGRGGSRPVWWFALGCGVLSGALQAASLPPWSWWGLAYLVAVPLLVAADRGRGAAARSAWGCGLGTLAFWLYSQSWVFSITDLGYVPLCMLQSLWTVVFVWVLARLRGRGVAFVLVAPLLWMGVEFLRGEVFAGGYACALVAYPLIAAPVLASPGAVLGVYFVGFLTVLVAAAVLDAGLMPRRRGLALGAVGVYLAVTLGCWGMRPRVEGTRRLAVAALQTNVPQDRKIKWTIDQELEDWSRMRSLVLAAPSGPRLWVWPETMLPGPTLERQALDEFKNKGIVFRPKDGSALEVGEFERDIMAVQRRLASPLIVGEVALEGLAVSFDDQRQVRLDQARRANSVYLIDEGRTQPGRYDKVCLTPFGETMPYISAWPWLEKQLLAVGARGMTFDLAAGRELTVFEVRVNGEMVRVVTPICFESTLASHLRRLVHGAGGRRADLIASVTNDGWFGSSARTREEHLQIARWRSLELATPTVRSANTGISAIVDALGRIVKSGVDGGGRAMVDGVLAGEVSLHAGESVFARVGNVAGWCGVVGVVGLAAAAMIMRPRNTEGAHG